MPRMTADQIATFLADHFPHAAGFCQVTAISDDSVDVIVPFRDRYLRPGGTLSGPTLMTLADTAMYFLVLAQLGPIALAVTSNLNIHFLRKPPPGDLHATARMLKLGKRQAVGEVHMRSPDGTLVAQASVTYALPASS